MMAGEAGSVWSNDAVIELYGAPTGNCLRAAIALEEAELPYTVRPVDLAAGEHKGPAYLALNPLGKVPTLAEHAGAETPLLLTQSNAIILYADSRAPGRLLPGAEGPDRDRVHERWFYFITDVIAVSHAAFALRARGEEAAAQLLAGRALDALQGAERFLEAGPFMAAEVFSVADISAFTFANSVRDSVGWDRHPQLARWFDAVGSRPAVIRGMNAFNRP